LFSGVLESQALRDISVGSDSKGVQFFEKISGYIENFSPVELIKEVFSNDKAQK